MSGPALAPPAVDAERVRRAVEEVLSRPEYAEAAPSLVARARAWLAEQLGRLLDALLSAGQASLLGTVLLVAFVAVAALLVARYLSGVRRDPAAEAAVGGPVGRTAGEWRAEADEHERAGRWREALRCHYRALVADLADAGVLEEVPGRTTGEYAAQLAAAVPGAAASFRAATEAFERAWYGHAPVDAADLDAFHDRAAATRRAVTGRVPAGV